jgi:DNA polymerase gamma 1
MGIMTHQAIERTWITASNAKQNRVGSELEAMMYALNGYVIVCRLRGAVDFELYG